MGTIYERATGSVPSIFVLALSPDLRNVLQTKYDEVRKGKSQPLLNKLPPNISNLSSSHSANASVPPSLAYHSD